LKSRSCCRPSTRAGASTSGISTSCVQVIDLRGYAQRDPLNEFKNEAFTLFERLLSDLRSDVTRMLMRGQFVAEQPRAMIPAMAAPAACRHHARRLRRCKPRRRNRWDNSRKVRRPPPGRRRPATPPALRLGQALQELPRRRDGDCARLISADRRHRTSRTPRGLRDVFVQSAATQSGLILWLLANAEQMPRQQRQDAHHADRGASITVFVTPMLVAPSPQSGSSPSCPRH